MYRYFSKIYFYFILFLFIGIARGFGVEKYCTVDTTDGRKSTKNNHSYEYTIRQKTKNVMFIGKSEFPRISFLSSAIVHSCFCHMSLMHIVKIIFVIAIDLIQKIYIVKRNIIFRFFFVSKIFYNAKKKNSVSIKIKICFLSQPCTHDNEIFYTFDNKINCLITVDSISKYFWEFLAHSFDDFFDIVKFYC